jgi:hypothetical protein
MFTTSCKGNPGTPNVVWLVIKRYKLRADLKTLNSVFEILLTLIFSVVSKIILVQTAQCDKSPILTASDILDAKVLQDKGESARPEGQRLAIFDSRV